MDRLFVTLRVALRFDLGTASAQVARRDLARQMSTVLQQLRAGCNAELTYSASTRDYEVQWLPYESDLAMQLSITGTSQLPRTAEDWGMRGAMPQIEADAAAALHAAVQAAAVEAFRRWIDGAFSVGEARAYVREALYTFADTWSPDDEIHLGELARSDALVSKVGAFAQRIFPDADPLAAVLAASG